MRYLKGNSLIFLPIILCIVSVFLFRQGIAMRTKKPKDYQKIRKEQLYGIGPASGENYCISFSDLGKSHQVTFKMNKYRALFVRLQSGSNASVIMLGSQPGSPRMLKAVWAYDDLNETIEFWTDRFWVSHSGCNVTGCPKIRFQVTRGTLCVKILKIRN